LLKELKIPIIGVVENMKINEAKTIQQKIANQNTIFLGEIPFDTKIEEAIGNVDKLWKTMFAEKVREIVSKSEI